MRRALAHAPVYNMNTSINVSCNVKCMAYSIDFMYLVYVLMMFAMVKTRWFDATDDSHVAHTGSAFLVFGCVST